MKQSDTSVESVEVLIEVDVEVLVVLVDVVVVVLVLALDVVVVVVVVVLVVEFAGFVKRVTRVGTGRVIRCRVSRIGVGLVRRSSTRVVATVGRVGAGRVVAMLGEGLRERGGIALVARVGGVRITVARVI